MRLHARESVLFWLWKKIQEIIAELWKGKSQRLASVPKSTVGFIWKDRDKIEAHVSASGNPSFAKKRCIVREPQFDKLDQACYIWFQQQHSKGAPMSGPVLQEKVLQPFSGFSLPWQKMMDLSKLVLVGLNVTMLVIHRSGNVATYIAPNIEKQHKLQKMQQKVKRKLTLLQISKKTAKLQGSEHTLWKVHSCLRTCTLAKSFTANSKLLGRA